MRYSSLSHVNKIHPTPRPKLVFLRTQNPRLIANIAARTLSRLLKLRYLVLGGAVAGGTTLKVKYEAWKEKFPDLSWVDEYMPDNDSLKGVVAGLNKFLSHFALPEKGWLKRNVNTLKDIVADSSEGLSVLSQGVSEGRGSFLNGALKKGEIQLALKESETSFSKGAATKEKERDRLEEQKEEFLEAQLRYQREIERLERENKQLKKALLLRGDRSSFSRREKKSLIDMYSEVLDELSGYDNSYNTQDHLPRVVVVGDQSAGKTSVLEMVAQARIFPRGSGEMMTRSPVKVTLSEGPQHVAQFKDSDRQFDLTQEKEVVVVGDQSAGKTSVLEMVAQARIFPRWFYFEFCEGNTNESIEEIKKYEQEFFRGSELFRSGSLKPSQLTTQNLSFAVSDIFWKMVRGSIEQQADTYKASRFNLETEWKNNFPRLRELDRDELFDKARGELLDVTMALGEITPKLWEDAISKLLWKQVSAHVFKNIYLPAAHSEDAGAFNTRVDIELRNWAEQQLSKLSVEVGLQTLQDEFGALIDQDKKNKDHDAIYDDVISCVQKESLSRHNWLPSNSENLRVIQFNTLEDRSVHDKQQWDAAVQFMEGILQEKMKEVDKKISELTGPGTTEKWLYWKSQSQEQIDRGKTKEELEKILQSDEKHKNSLMPDEVTTVRRNLFMRNVEVDDKFVQDTWQPIYRKHFLQRSLALAQECRKGFYHYQRGFNDTGPKCHDIVLFWRIQRMLQLTSNALRQQIVNTEVRRLEKEVKEVLDDFMEDENKKKHLLYGRRVELAEELKRVRRIQEKLEDFIAALNKEK
ncbi:dynamin-like 120 kDa protein, mitochondrial [Anneissia japonica]|uniref:dynamin-like 120 kDa protein, mitochondrial n=1 Tax=Anneissia japonica TaxID=1529436 RepID=UPI00142562C0|nr:dynamin-like 120 kDa protein, mitochondrial [Anneissia japonica]